MPFRVIPGPDQSLPGVVVERGLQVLATADRLDTVAKLPVGWVGNQFYLLRAKSGQKDSTLRLVPFADAGQTGGHYQVLLDPITLPVR